MKGFVSGFIFALVIIVLAAFLILNVGYISFSADKPVNPLETKIAMHALDESVEHHAHPVQDPLQPTDETLLAGARLYRDNCAGCHGDPSNMDTQLGDSFNPPAPQFWMDSPDMPDWQNFYIVQHGVRWTGMPAWNKKLNDTQIWQVITLLGHIDKLPAPVNEELTKSPAAK